MPQRFSDPNALPAPVMWLLCLLVSGALWAGLGWIAVSVLHTFR